MIITDIHFSCTSKSTDLAKNKRFFIVDRVEAIVRHHTCAELSTNGVSRQAIHVHLHIGPNLFV